MLHTGAVVLVMLSLLFGAKSSAQTPDSTTNSNVRIYHNYFFLGPVLKSRSLIFGAQSRTNENIDLDFQPNSSASLGVNAYLMDLVIEASVSIPLGNKSVSRFGDSDVSDLQIGVVGRKFFGDIYWQRYSGFYYTYPGQSIAADEAYPQRPDIDAGNFGLTLGYVFNHEKFSLRSAYTFVDRQLQSKGSPVLAFVVSSFDIAADSSFFPDSQRPADEFASVDQVRFSSLGFTGGYSYNFVIERWFVNLTLSLGPAHYWVRYHRPEIGDRHNIDINWVSNFRVGLGYNADRFFAGVTYNSQRRNVTFEQLHFDNAIGTFRFVLGYRFREFGPLKKRVWDFLPRPKTSS
jgi:hypothetical protein